MRIIFVCGSLEAGSDGVGDYVRKMAAQLISKGNQVGAIALNDAYLKEGSAINECSGDSQLSILRLPSHLHHDQRVDLAQSWIYEFKPDWLSLQFVIFAYNDKGLPFKFPKLVQRLSTGIKWHIMFHEIWIGELKTDTFKQKVTGIMQVSIIKQLVKKIKPLACSTSNNYYVDCLKSIGITASISTVFSNMPVGDEKSRVLFNQLPANVLQNRGDYIIASFFGTIHYNDYLSEGFKALQKLARKASKNLMITHVGKADNITDLWHSIELSAGDLVHSFGRQTEQDIADYFSQIDVGLSTNPKILYEKSGSIAAMLNNKLPVILLRKSFLPDNRIIAFVKEPEEIQDIEAFINQPKNFDRDFSADNVAVNFIKLLQERN